jgi:hypothetical protein
MPTWLLLLPRSVVRRPHHPALYPSLASQSPPPGGGGGDPYARETSADAVASIPVRRCRLRSYWSSSPAALVAARRRAIRARRRGQQRSPGRGRVGRLLADQVLHGGMSSAPTANRFTSDHGHYRQTNNAVQFSSEAWARPVQGQARATRCSVHWRLLQGTRRGRRWAEFSRQGVRVTLSRREAGAQALGQPPLPLEVQGASCSGRLRLRTARARWSARRPTPILGFIFASSAEPANGCDEAARTGRTP